MRQLDELSKYACQHLAGLARIRQFHPLIYKQWITRTGTQTWKLSAAVLTIAPPTMAVPSGVVFAVAPTVNINDMPSDAMKYLIETYDSNEPKRATSTALRCFTVSQTKYDVFTSDVIDESVSVFDSVAKERSWSEAVLKAGVDKSGADETKRVLAELGGDQGKRMSGCLSRYETARNMCQAIFFARRVNDVSAFVDHSISDSLVSWVLDPRMMPLQFYEWFQSRYSGPDGFWDDNTQVQPSQMMKRQFAVSYERLSRVVIRKQKQNSFEFQPSEVQ